MIRKCCTGEVNSPSAYAVRCTPRDDLLVLQRGEADGLIQQSIDRTPKSPDGELVSQKIMYIGTLQELAIERANAVALGNVRSPIRRPACTEIVVTQCGMNFLTRGKQAEMRRPRLRKDGEVDRCGVLDEGSSVQKLMCKGDPHGVSRLRILVVSDKIDAFGGASDSCTGLSEIIDEDESGRYALEQPHHCRAETKVEKQRPESIACSLRFLDLGQATS